MDGRVAITLLRHGVTKANQERRYIGWTDLPLTEDAKNKLREVRSFGSSFDLCVTSDLLRARETAAILCPTLELILIPSFREMHFGDWEMKTYEDLKQNVTYRSWINDPDKVTPTGGESFREMTTRVKAGFEYLRSEVNKKGNKEILLLTHGGVIRYLLTELTNDPKDFFEWDVPHDKGYELIWTKQDWEDGNRCTLFQEVPLTAKENG